MPIESPKDTPGAGLDRTLQPLRRLLLYNTGYASPARDLRTLGLMQALRIYWNESLGTKSEEDSIGNSIEGYVLKAQLAYWKPGAWFKYACVDRTQPAWDVPAAANNFGINPNRTIAPVFGTYLALEMNF